ncbi:hypothetical protein GZH47_08340 [Paenibacillus rhizovicinus]|uniref:O-antigen ligase family protein n=1 Tax=Paenibacillus rhizovicinus TaxID=2704463 RepID=A0A6C0NXE5_9BACL|nr:hypothetical protein [Paenibacillus rhizovicinus]QHW30858.1 hypothetical protein GZH47_08340 [Paenibacillus rhizovicinus]
MKIRVNKLALWGLFASIIASENFFYLFKGGEDARVIGALSLKDIFVFMGLFWIGMIMFLLREQPSPKYHFKWIILFTLILMITSSIQSHVLYGQSITMGIRPQRFWIVWALMYFPITKALYLKEITYEKIEKIIFIIGTLELVIYISQYFLQNQVQFLNVMSNNVYSTTRFYVSNIFLNLLLFINLNRLFNKEKIIKSTLYIVAVLFVIIIVGKMRMTFIAVASAILIGFIFWKKGGILKFLTFLVLVAVAIYLTNLEEVQAIILSFQGKSTVDTLSIREIGRDFYISILKQHPILGGGYINTQWYPAAIASNYLRGIYWVDNGIFGFAYFYGLLGIVWVLVLFRKLFVMGSKVKRALNSYVFFIMPMYWVIAMVDELHWYYNSFLVMTLLICMLEEKFRKIDVGHGGNFESNKKLSL